MPGRGFGHHKPVEAPRGLAPSALSYPTVLLDRDILLRPLDYLSHHLFQAQIEKAGLFLLTKRTSNRLGWLGRRGMIAHLIRRSFVASYDETGLSPKLRETKEYRT
jgi:hypothetical protein